MKILVCGGRTYGDRITLFAILDRVLAKHPGLTVIQGGAKGADLLAKAWAEARGIPVETFVADWEHQGRSAGPKRNKRMLEVGQPDAVIAFPGGIGTGHMVGIARKSGVPVWEPITYR